MKRIIELKLIVTIMFLMTFPCIGQELKDCESCDTRVITMLELENKELYEIELLRNEIFARHNYTFKNERLTAYFNQFSWYLPNDKFIPLNEIEQRNVETFKTKESEIKEFRKTLISALSKLKTAVNKQDNQYLLNSYGNYEEGSFYDIYLITVKQVLDFVKLEQINWHKGIGLYTVQIDNGFAIDNYSLTIKGAIISISVSNSGHSSLMNSQDAWEYPSTYYSEEYESYMSFDLKFKEGKLKVVNAILAG